MKRLWNSDRDFFKGLFVIEALIFALLLSFGVIAQPQVNLEAVKTIESNGNPHAVSHAGAVGLFQVMPVTLEEYNNFHLATYERKDLFNPEVNRKIAEWYLSDRIPDMLKYYDKAVTTRNILWAYNAGIGRLVDGVLPEETKNYIAKYRRLVS